MPTAGARPPLVLPDCTVPPPSHPLRAVPAAWYDDPAMWDRLPTDRDLPSEGGEPLESFWHVHAMTLLMAVLDHHWRDRADVVIGGNNFVYFSPDRVFHKDFRGPDVWAVAGGVDGRRRRQSWVAWRENGRLPDLIVELASPSTAGVDRGPKRQLYGEVFGTAEYFIYDPARHAVEGWRLAPGADGYGDRLVPDALGRLPCELLGPGATIGPWAGRYLSHDDRWPRFFAADGSPLPTAAEAEAARAEQEKVRADRAAAAAEQERARAEQERQRADEEAARRELERRRGDQEKERADALEAELARLRADLAARTPPQP